MFRKRAKPERSYDREKLRPVIRASICTGERVAGFRELGSGRFSEVMLIRGPEDLAQFRALYGIGPEEELPTEY